MTIKEDIERLLLTDLAADSGRNSLDPNEDLLAQGIIDSLGIIKLIAILESTYGLRIVDEEVIPENFQTLNCISQFVERKKMAA